LSERSISSWSTLRSPHHILAQWADELARRKHYSMRYNIPPSTDILVIPDRRAETVRSSIPARSRRAAAPLNAVPASQFNS
jgi:hypothetical protein